jgi:hypothetical protein
MIKQLGLGMALALASFLLWTTVITGTSIFQGGKVGMALVICPLISLALLTFGLKNAALGPVEYSFYSIRFIKKTRWAKKSYGYHDVKRVKYHQSYLNTGNASVLRAEMFDGGKIYLSSDNATRVADLFINAVADVVEKEIEAGGHATWVKELDLTRDGVFNRRTNANFNWSSIDGAKVITGTDLVTVTSEGKRVCFAGGSYWNFWPGYEIVRRRGRGIRPWAELL